VKAHQAAAEVLTLRDVWAALLKSRDDDSIIIINTVT
jgi:hypothetical protein